MATGFTAKLRVLVDRLESEVELCRRTRIADIDPQVFRLLEDTHQIISDEAAEQKSLLEGTEEDSEIEDDDDRENWVSLDLDWVSSLPHAKIHASLSQRRAPGTCEWLLNREDFSSWENSDRSAIFWLRAPCKFYLVFGQFGHGISDTDA